MQSIPPQDLTDAAGRKAAADLLDVLLRAPETLCCGASDDRLMVALAELAKKVRVASSRSFAAHLQGCLAINIRCSRGRGTSDAMSVTVCNAGARLGCDAGRRTAADHPRPQRSAR